MRGKCQTNLFTFTLPRTGSYDLEVTVFNAYPSFLKYFCEFYCGADTNLPQPQLGVLYSGTNIANGGVVTFPQTVPWVFDQRCSVLPIPVPVPLRFRPFKPTTNSLMEILRDKQSVECFFRLRNRDQLANHFQRVVQRFNHGSLCVGQQHCRWWEFYRLLGRYSLSHRCAAFD